jgi:hypothetical protein
MIGISIGAILAALASMAYVFGGMRRLEDSVRDLEERARKREGMSAAPPEKQPGKEGKTP